MKTNEILQPSPAEVKATRVATGLTQRVCATRFGYSLTGWQKKEDAGPSGRGLPPGEYELLQLLADSHPTLRIQLLDESLRGVDAIAADRASGSDVRAARVAAGMTLQACADRFGYPLRAWQKREQSGPGATTLAPAEYELLRLLGDGHPVYRLLKRRNRTKEEY